MSGQAGLPFCGCCCLIANWLPAHSTRHHGWPLTSLCHWALSLIHGDQMSLFQTPAVSGNPSGPLWGWCWALPHTCPSALPAKRGGDVLQPSPSLLQPLSALCTNLWHPKCAHPCCPVATAKHPLATALWATQESPLISRCIQAFLVKSLSAHCPQVSYRPRVRGSVWFAFLVCVFLLWALGTAQGELAVFGIPCLWWRCSIQALICSAWICTGGKHRGQILPRWIMRAS